MAGKFMKIRKIIIPTLTLAIMVSCLSGCSCSTQGELHKMIERGEQIEIEVAEPNFTEQGTESKITWVELASNTEDASFRAAFELLLGITNENGIKNGVAYINLDGKTEQNNTLYNAFMNKAFVKNYWNNDEIQQAVKIAVAEHYADVESDSETAKYAALNLYWNLLPDYEPNYANMGASLTRAEAMTLLMRATTPVTSDGKPASNDAFRTLVGESDYTDYASYLDSRAFINTSDKSLNNQTFNGTMTRGEFIYLLINNTFGSDAINNVDVSNTKLNDCKDGGDIAKTQKFEGKDYCKSYEIVYAIQNPDNGAPTPIYKAIVKAKQLDIISAETAWDEALTREDAVEIFAETMIAYSNLNGYKTEVENSTDIVETDYRAIAIAKYNEISSQLSVPQETYVDKYIELIGNGGTKEETEAFLLDYYKIKDTTNNDDGSTVKDPSNTGSSVADPFSLAPSGSYTDKVVATRGEDYSWVLRTYSNGAQRYYFKVKIANIMDKEYIADKPGEIPNNAMIEIEKLYDELFGTGDTGNTGNTGNNTGNTGNNTGNTGNTGNNSGSNSSDNGNNGSSTEDDDTVDWDSWDDPVDWDPNDSLEGGIKGPND